MEKENPEYEWYNLKYQLAEFIIPKLEMYKTQYIKEGMCIPDWVIDKKQKTYSESEIQELNMKWHSELDHMILAFKQILNYNTGEDPKMGYDAEFIQDGLNKFAQYFQHFWD